MARITLEKQVQRDKKIEEMLKEGLPQVHIAKQIKCSASTVNKLAKKIYKPSKWVDPDSEPQNTLDTQILKKLIPKFVENKMKVTLSKKEIKRIQELWAIIEEEEEEE